MQNFFSILKYIEIEPVFKIGVSVQNVHSVQKMLEKYEQKLELHEVYSISTARSLDDGCSIRTKDPR